MSDVMTRHAADLILEREGDRYRVVKHRAGREGRLVSLKEAITLLKDMRVKHGQTALFGTVEKTPGPLHRPK